VTVYDFWPKITTGSHNK